MLGRKVIICSAIGATVALFAGAGLAFAQTTPSVQPDVATTAPDTAVVIDVLANDTDTLGAFVPGSITIPTPPLDGAAVVNSDGTITYTPAMNFIGTDQFSYMVCDNEVSQFCASALVTVTVATPSATASPTATETPAPTLETWPVTNPDHAGTDTGKAVTLNVLANDTDSAAAIDMSSLKVVTPPTNGTATVDATGVATYTPTGDFSGTDSFVYQVCDLQADPHCSQGTVTVTVSPLATATPETPAPTAVATDTPAPPTTTATPPAEAATPKPPATGSGVGAATSNSISLLLLAIVGLGAIGAASAVAGLALTHRGR